MLEALIVTVAYNPPDSVVQNLEINLYRHLVVDNSDQETIWLKDYCNQYGHAYRWLGENFGIAKALNVGAEYAIDSGYDYIVTMDQDSKLTAEFINTMDMKICFFHQSNSTSVFSPRYRVWGVNDNELSKPQSYSEDITLPMTSGNWVNLNIWKYLGGFNNDLFIDCVDVEYYIRSRLCNYRVITFLDVFLEHSLGTKPVCRWVGKYGFEVWNHSAIRKYYIARNYNYMYWKYKDKVPEMRLYYKIMYKMPFSVIFFEENKLHKLWFFFRGYLDFLRGKYGKFK